MKKIDCITFFNENLMFEIRYNILKDFVDFFVVCESLFDHRGNNKKLNFDQKRFKSEKIKALRHVFTPSLSFSYRPDFSEDKFGYLVYDVGYVLT